MSIHFQFTEAGILQVGYAETEHYQITRDFLNRHERMMEILMTAEENDFEATKWKL